MTSSTLKNANKQARFDEEFIKTIEDLDKRFWETMEYEKDLYAINRHVNVEEE